MDNSQLLESNRISAAAIGASIEVHKHLGPGLLESAYQACLEHELKREGISHCSQVALPVRYKGLELDCGYIMDVVLEDRVVIELKAVHELQPIHEAQLLAYLKLSNRKLGLLINFNVPVLKDGIRRIVNG